jgi:transposase
MTPRATDSPIEKARSAPKKGKQRSRRTRSQQKALPEGLKQVHLNAAGIDIGAGSHYVAVPKDRDAQPVRHFSSFTIDLYAIADWLETCGIETVAMESTGVYWVPLYQVLEERGFEVLLVDPHKLKHAPGRKTDVLDCQWIQQLHTFGLLTGAFRPAAEVCALRSYMRQRELLISQSGEHTQRMQKALELMSVKLTQVLSDITGKTGMLIIRAILDGERDPAKLAQFRDRRCRRDEATIALALQGDWRAEHLFSLRQAVELYDVVERMMADCDVEIEAQMRSFGGSLEDLAPLGKKSSSNASHPFAFDAYSELYRIAGVDLTEVPGLDAPSVASILSEIGVDTTLWRDDSAFASWLGVCPGSKVTGGKRLSSRSKRCANRAAVAFRLAAFGLQSSKTYLGACYRRLKARMGAPKAITAMAHKLARIVYAMLRDKTSYVERGMSFFDQEYRSRAIANLKRNAKRLGYQLTEIPDPASLVAAT